MEVDDTCNKQFDNPYEIDYQSLTKKQLQKIIFRLEGEESFAVILRDALTIEECDYALETLREVPTTDWTPIYRSGYEIKNKTSSGRFQLKDGKQNKGGFLRVQNFCHERIIGASGLSRKILSFNPLRSEPKAVAQCMHTDARTEERRERYALGEGNILEAIGCVDAGYPIPTLSAIEEGGYYDPMWRQKFQLNRRDIVLFNGSFPHGGSKGFEHSVHFRIHVEVADTFAIHRRSDAQEWLFQKPQIGNTYQLWVKGGDDHRQVTVVGFEPKSGELSVINENEMHEKIPKHLWASWLMELD